MQPLLMILQLKRILHKNRSFLFLLFFLFWLIFSYISFVVCLWYFEDMSWAESDWVAWQTFSTVGFGDTAIKSFNGRFFTRFFGTWGIVFMGAIASSVIEMSVTSMNKRRAGLMKNKIRNGYIFVNWPGMSDLVLFLNQIREDEPGAGVCIIDETLEELPPEALDHGHVSFVKGSIIDENTYLRAMINKNKGILVFPKDRNNSSTDALTSTVVELLEELTLERVYIAYLLVNPSNQRLFKSARRAIPFLASMGTMAAARQFHAPGTGEAIVRALSCTDSAGLLTFEADRLEGWQWGDFLAHIPTACHQCGISLSVIGLVPFDSHAPVLCPPLLRKIAKGDKLMVLASGHVNWVWFENSLIKAAA